MHRVPVSSGALTSDHDKKQVSDLGKSHAERERMRFFDRYVNMASIYVYKVTQHAKLRFGAPQSICTNPDVVACSDQNPACHPNLPITASFCL